MKTAIIIPARHASTRLPGKPLLDETGWPLIRHVWEQARQSRLASRVIIATDDDRIANAVRVFGGEVVMTDPAHPTGTDRLAEVAEKHGADIDLIVNVQGDEPEMEPGKIDALIRLYQVAGMEVATLACPFPTGLLDGPGSPLDPACCKVVLGAPIRSENDVLGYQALYFSRSLIPFPRDAQGAVTAPQNYFQHLGIYAYAPSFLRRYVALPMGRLESAEKLEQLRVLENGHKIAVGITTPSAPGIDTREDYDAFLARWKNKA